MSDIIYFLLIYFIVLGMFANAVYCLSLNRDPDDEDSAIIDQAVNNRVFDSILNQYLLSLGEFGTDNYGAGEKGEDWVLWIFFILSTFITSITILNMLIAIMGDTFGKVTEIKDQSALREKVCIIADFVFLVTV